MERKKHGHCSYALEEDAPNVLGHGSISKWAIVAAERPLCRYLRHQQISDLMGIYKLTRSALDHKSRAIFVVGLGTFGFDGAR